jgi:enoyl-CoA hydratase
VTASESSRKADELIAERRGSVQWITFNRPDTRNALTWNMYARLAEVCNNVNRDPEVRAMVLTGAGGKAFVAGTDIALLRELKTEQDVLDYEARGDEVFTTLESVRVPTIAALAGACTGAGAVIAAACDLRVATPSTRYGFPIARTLGNCLSMANIVRVAALVGFSRFTDMLMRARLLDASEMRACGLLAELVPDEASLLDRAQTIAEEVADNAPLTLWATKTALRRIRERLVTEGADRDLVLRCYLSRDFKEGVDAFLEKRKPFWIGE